MRKLTGCAVGICLVALVVIVASCQYGAPTPTPAPTPPSIPMTLYEDAEHGFSIEYPEGWAQQSHGAATSFSFQFNDPEGRLSASASVDYKPEEISLADAVSEDKGYMESSPQFEMISEGNVTIGEGISGYEMIGEGDVDTGKVEKFRYVVLVREKQVFWVGVSGEPDQFDEQKQLVDTIIDSFKLLSTYTFVVPAPSPQATQEPPLPSETEEEIYQEEITYWEWLTQIEPPLSHRIENVTYYGNVIVTEGINCENNTCYSSACEVDFKEAPEMLSFAKKVAKICEVNCPKIKQKLVNEEIEPPYEIVIKRELEYSGMVQGTTVYLNSQWFKEHPDDLGAVVHEMAHVFQQYPAGSPFWLVEGIADYIRFCLGFESPWSYPHCCQECENYTSGYWCAAAFLNYIERVYDPEVVTKLDKALRERQYSDSLFELYTGKTLDQLWQECQKYECKETSEPGLWGFMEVDKSYAAGVMTLLRSWGASEGDVQCYWGWIKEEGQGKPLDFIATLKEFGYTPWIYLGHLTDCEEEFTEIYDDYLLDPSEQVKSFENKEEAFEYIKKLVALNIPVMTVIEGDRKLGEGEARDNDYVVVIGYTDSEVSYYTLPGVETSVTKEVFFGSWELQGEGGEYLEFPGSCSVMFLKPRD